MMLTTGVFAMKANRRFLYWGLFFIALGVVLTASNLNAIGDAAIADALRLWPLAVIAIGAAIVLRRTRYSMGAWVIAATLPGLALGGAIATAPRFTLECLDGSRPVLIAQGGAFEGTASVSVKAGCGALSVSTAPGSSWHIQPGPGADATAIVSATSSSLTIDAGTLGRWGGSPSEPSWDLVLPTSPIDDLAVRVNATQAKVDLSGADVSHLDVALDLGEMSLVLPGGHDLTGSLDAHLAGLTVCAPPDLGLRIHEGSELGAIKYAGFAQGSGVWQSPGYELATSHAELTASVSLGQIEFNPIGGCK
jgi:hypothetical protein